jgi:hypothetical protein
MERDFDWYYDTDIVDCEREMATVFALEEIEAAAERSATPLPAALMSSAVEEMLEGGYEVWSEEDDRGFAARAKFDVAPEHAIGLALTRLKPPLRSTATHSCTRRRGGRRTIRTVRRTRRRSARAPARPGGDDEDPAVAGGRGRAFVSHGGRR